MFWREQNSDQPSGRATLARSRFRAPRLLNEAIVASAFSDLAGIFQRRQEISFNWIAPIVSPSFVTAAGSVIHRSFWAAMPLARTPPRVPSSNAAQKLEQRLLLGRTQRQECADGTRRLATMLHDRVSDGAD